jgi:hypothetical protein
VEDRYSGWARFPVDRFWKFSEQHHRKIWVMLLEKAWIKSFESCDNIRSGYNEEGLVAISGTHYLSFLQKEQLSHYHESLLEKRAISTCTISRDVRQLTEQEQETGSRGNPWGRKVWKGDWPFSSKKKVD